MNYPLGSLLRLKTTGENVVIIGDVADNEELVSVRRPINNPAGVQHVIEEFYLNELDTVEESIRREFNEMKIRQALINSETKTPEAILIQ